METEELKLTIKNDSPPLFIVIIDDSNDKPPTVILHKVVVPANHVHIHGVGVVGVVELKSLKQSFKGCTWYCDVVGVLEVPLVLCGGVDGRCKEVVESGVRYDDLRSFIWVWGVVTLA